MADFHVTKAGTDDAGFDLSGTAPTDRAGNARSNFDAGAYEYIAPSSSVASRKYTYYRKRR